MACKHWPKSVPMQVLRISVQSDGIRCRDSGDGASLHVIAKLAAQSDATPHAVIQWHLCVFCCLSWGRSGCWVGSPWDKGVGFSLCCSSLSCLLPGLICPITTMFWRPDPCSSPFSRLPLSLPLDLLPSSSGSNQPMQIRLRLQVKEFIPRE